MLWLAEARRGLWVMFVAGESLTERLVSQMAELRVVTGYLRPPPQGRSRGLVG